MGIVRRGIIRQETTAIAAAAIQAWNTTPIAISSASGVGRIIQPIALQLQYKFGTLPFGVTDFDNFVASYAAYVDLNHDNGAPTAFNGTGSELIRQTADHVSLGLAQSLAVQGAGLVAGHVTADVTNKPLLLKGDNDLQGGAVATVTLNAAGLLYAVNDTGHILQGSNNSATYRVSTIGGGGAVTAVVITAGGTNYGVANGLSTDTSGAGSGLKLNVTAVNKGDGSLITTVFYGIVRLS